MDMTYNNYKYFIEINSINILEKICCKSIGIF